MVSYIIIRRIISQNINFNPYDQLNYNNLPSPSKIQFLKAVQLISLFQYLLLQLPRKIKRIRLQS